MTTHDAIKKQVAAWKLLMQAQNICTSGPVIELIRKANDIIYDVGEKRFGQEFLNELRYSTID